jgi:hypothetical protein
VCDVFGLRRRGTKLVESGKGVVRVQEEERNGRNGGGDFVEGEEGGGPAY